MKILLDECVPIQIRSALPDHEVPSATEPAWRGLSNGELLTRSELEGFHLIIVADKNLRYQQALSNRRIAISELWTNHRPTLERYYKYIRENIEQISPRKYLQLAAPDF
jgi:hypothetical protein